MKVLVQNKQKQKVNLSLLKSLAGEILRDLGCDGAELSVLLTDNKGIHGLNKTYRNKNRPTDVLSFPMNDPEILGDIVISVEMAKAQAGERDVKEDEELARLLIHGILHILGFDHEVGRKETLRMKKEEERLMGIARCKLQKAQWKKTGNL